MCYPMKRIHVGIVTVMLAVMSVVTSLQILL